MHPLPPVYYCHSTVFTLKSLFDGYGTNKCKLMQHSCCVSFYAHKPDITSASDSSSSGVTSTS